MSLKNFDIRLSYKLGFIIVVSALIGTAVYYLVNFNTIDIREHTENQAIFDRAQAIEKVLQEHPEFPYDFQDTNTIEVRSGGPAPGAIIKADLRTEVEPDGEDAYIVTLTKKWNAVINNIQPISYWQYRVSADETVLLASEDNDQIIRIIK